MESFFLEKNSKRSNIIWRKTSKCKLHELLYTGNRLNGNVNQASESQNKILEKKPSNCFIQTERSADHLFKRSFLSPLSPGKINKPNHLSIQSVFFDKDQNDYCKSREFEGQSRNGRKLLFSQDFKFAERSKNCDFKELSPSQSKFMKSSHMFRNSTEIVEIGTNKSIKKYLELLSVQRSSIDIFAPENQRKISLKKAVLKKNKQNIKSISKNLIKPLERFEFDYDKIIDEIIIRIRKLIEIVKSKKKSLRNIKRCSSFNPFLFDYLLSCVQNDHLERIKPVHFHCFLKACIEPKWDEEDENVNTLLQKRRILLVNLQTLEIFGKVNFRAINSLTFFNCNLDETIMEIEKENINKQKLQIQSQMQQFNDFEDFSPESKIIKSKIKRFPYQNYDLLTILDAYEKKNKISLNIPINLRMKEKQLTEAISILTK